MQIGKCKEPRIDLWGTPISIVIRYDGLLSFYYVSHYAGKRVYYLQCENC